MAEYAKFPSSIVEKAKHNAEAAAAAKTRPLDSGPSGKRQRTEQDAAIESALLDFSRLPLHEVENEEKAQRALAAWRERAQRLLDS